MCTVNLLLLLLLLLCFASLLGLKCMLITIITLNILSVALVIDLPEVATIVLTIGDLLLDLL